MVHVAVPLQLASAKTGISFGGKVAKTGAVLSVTVTVNELVIKLFAASRAS